MLKNNNSTSSCMVEVEIELNFTKNKNLKYETTGAYWYAELQKKQYSA